MAPRLRVLGLAGERVHLRASKEALFEALRDDLLRRIHASFNAPAPAGRTFAQQLELLLQR